MLFGWDHGALKEASPDNPLPSQTDPALQPESPQDAAAPLPQHRLPTGIDQRDDLGAPDRYDVDDGMADNRIGVARLDVPELLPSE